MKQSLRSDDPPVQDFIAMIAHDLRTPVTAIKGFGQLALRQGGESPQVRLYLKAVISEANRIASLVDDLVLVSSIEDGSRAPAETRIVLGSVFASLIEIMAAAEIRVEVLSASPSVVARGDTHLTERALANLIRLAQKYCRDEGPIYLDAQEGAGSVTIWVTTHPETPLSLNLDECDSVTSGSENTSHAMGAYIAVTLIEAQGGRIRTASMRSASMGNGIGFGVVLPAANT